MRQFGLEVAVVWAFTLVLVNAPVHAWKLIEAGVRTGQPTYQGGQMVYVVVAPPQ
jgi:hypothetical protein